MKISIILGIKIIIISLFVIGCENMNNDTISNEVISENSTSISLQYFDQESSDTANDEALFYSIRGRYMSPITRAELGQAETLSDLIEYYPSNWILEYISVEVTTIYHGIETTTFSQNDVLTTEQKDLFKSINLATDIFISVKYNTKESVTNVVESNQLDYSLTVMPEKETEFKGGYERMMAYLQKNTNEGMSDYLLEKDKAILIDSLKRFQQTTVVFTINKEGDVENAKMENSSGDAEVDRLLIELITKMPKWKPAEDPQGSIVNQELVFVIGKGGC